MTVALVDYGAGNLTSVVKALTAVGARVLVVSSPDRLSGIGIIVIPGVGHFGQTGLLDGPWRDAIRTRIDAGGPVLGICLGLHWLFEGSDEAPGVKGLGVFQGRCCRIQGDVKVPHVGWNSVDPTGRRSRLLEGIAPGSSAYFSHSFAVSTSCDAVATTAHGHSFVSVAERDLVFGTQFHPEKSAASGLRLLGNFLAAARRA